jgi:hypothetical protein
MTSSSSHYYSIPFIVTLTQKGRKIFCPFDLIPFPVFTIMEMKSILRVMDHVAAGLVVLCGLYSSVSSCEYARIGSLAMIAAGIAALTYLRFHWLVHDARGIPTHAPCKRKRDLRLNGSKCPKPILPSGPIHVLEVSEGTENERMESRVSVEEPVNVPETIAAIWETVPGVHESCNIWSIT